MDKQKLRARAKSFRILTHHFLFLLFLERHPRQDMIMLRGAQSAMPFLKKLGLIETERSGDDAHFRVSLSAAGYAAIKPFASVSLTGAAAQAAKRKKKTVSNAELAVIDHMFTRTRVGKPKEPRPTGQLKHPVTLETRVFLWLCEHGFTLDAIAKAFNRSRDAVRVTTERHPEYLAMRERRRKFRAEEKRNEKTEFENRRILKSIGGRFPERVALLWDGEKNGDRLPEEVLCFTQKVKIWLRCPECRYSWQKTPERICSLWKKGTSGCPRCAGKKNVQRKLPPLSEAHPDFVASYWDYEKNRSLEIPLDPTRLRCGSNKTAYFKCPIDGSTWTNVINYIHFTQWSKGHSGCMRCKGKTGKRHTSPDQKEKRILRRAILTEYPEQTLRMWDFKKNAEIFLDPVKITAGSGRSAYFLCPENPKHSFKTQISTMTATWARGRAVRCSNCGGRWNRPPD